MAKEKRIPKEYAIVVSLIMFFTVVIVVGITRVYLVTKDRLNRMDLSAIDVLEVDTNIDLSSYNIRIADAIRRDYGVDIYYGDDLSLESVNAVPVTDPDNIFDMLRQVNAVLSKYPKDLVHEIESKDYTISIYLVDHFTNGIEALANRNTSGQMKIYIGNTIDFERALHHEYYHILDYYIRLENDESIIYKDWDKYNPRGFMYSGDVNNITSKYIYYGESGAYFVTPYAKYSEKEDKAETFAEMITASKDEIFFNEGEPINGKISVIKKTLYNVFESVRREPILAWE